MSEHVEETVEPEAPVAETPETEAEQFSVSKEDWGTLVGAVREVYQRGQQNAPPQEDPEEDYEEGDLGSMIAKYVEDQVGPMRDVAARAAEREGKEYMNQLFDQAEKNPEIGKFDRAVAENLSHAYFVKAGQNPQYAQWAAIEGAKEAARLQRDWGKSAVDEYKKSIKTQPFSDGPAALGGIRSEKKPESMDDVIENWEAQYGQGAQEV